jgi:hypothetical protein
MTVYIHSEQYYINIVNVADPLGSIRGTGVTGPELPRVVSPGENLP